MRDVRMSQVLLCAGGMLCLSACGLTLSLGLPDQGDAGAVADGSTVQKDASSFDAKGDVIATDAGLDARADGAMVDAASSDADAAVTPRRVFLSDVNYTGAEINGVVNADTKCNNLAAAANLGASGKWHAILGQDETYAAIITRIGNRIAPIVRVDAQPVVADITKLLTAKPSLENPINVNQKGLLAQGSFAWTGISADGNRTGETDDHCIVWTSDDNAQTGVYGEAGKKNSEFLMVKSGMGTDSCSVKHRLYCLEE